MSEIVIVAALVGSALIHLAPVVGVVSVASLEKLYATTIEGPDLAVMMRHRALLFGIVAALLVLAIFMPALRWPIVIATLVSDVGFVALMRAHRGTTPALGRVLVADLVSIGLLAGAVVLLSVG